MGDDVCDAELAPAWCGENSYSHICERPALHDAPHGCACGHQWTEPDQ